MFAVRLNFNTAGPSSEAMSLDEGLESLTSFRQRLTHIDEQGLELNEYQRVFKMPLTNFRVLRILKDEFQNLEEIYTIFSGLQVSFNLSLVGMIRKLLFMISE